MKTRTTILIPFALGLMVSACSTTTSTSSQGQSAEITQASVTPPASSAQASVDQASELMKQISEKNKKIASLGQELTDNNAQLLELHKSLDEKDKLIATLEKPLSNAESLVELEKEKRLRESLESQYAELNVENDRLVNQIKSLQAENRALKQKVSTATSRAPSSREFLALNNSFQTLGSEHYALKQEYQTLTKEHALLQKKYDSLSKENQINQQALTALKKENLRLGGEISEARSQHQMLWDKVRLQRDVIDHLQKSTSVATDANSFEGLDNSELQNEIIKLKSVVSAQKSLIADYQGDVVKLQATLESNVDNSAKEQQLEKKLSKLEALNSKANQQLVKGHAALLASQAEQESLSKSLASAQAQQASLQQQLASIKEQAKTSESQRLQLESQINNLIPFQAEVNALQGQIDSGLSNVKWQLPDEMSLHNNFEILVTATVDKPVAGQTYVAELVTDSAIQMVSASEAEAVVQNGQLQWRWRVNGLNERPKAKLNLFISQQMNYKNQRIMRQVYRDSDTVALTNDNLFDKYGYWGIAILVGLFGGFLVGRINRKDKNS